jgi:hypothetical protein
MRPRFAGKPSSSSIVIFGTATTTASSGRSTRTAASMSSATVRRCTYLRRAFDLIGPVKCRCHPFLHCARDVSDFCFPVRATLTARHGSIHSNFSYPTLKSWIPDPFFRIYLNRIHRDKVRGMQSPCLLV